MSKSFGLKALRTLARAIPRKPLLLSRERSALPTRSLLRIQEGTLQYSFKGTPCLKNPFDLSLYTLLIGELQPKTIIEIGSAFGGSARWMSAICRGMGFDTQVISVDIVPVQGIACPNVEFISGDIYALEKSELPTILKDARHPLLVVEDGPHTFRASLSALRFFDRYLKSGDYIVVEDGIVNDLRYLDFLNGPNRAIRAFLRQSNGCYQVDRRLCNFFGQNVTWNTNGYLKKL